MTRREREDCEGRWHHVINRGLAKRPLFETRADMRYFLSRLAHEVRRSRIEIAAYCLLTTHFHLLVRSPVGELAEVMRRVQNEHSRRFNRQHARDGTLVRGRYWSRPIFGAKYREAVLHYIDRNPVDAGIVWNVGDYPFSSAFHYARARTPRWMSCVWVEEIVTCFTGKSVFAEGDYLRFSATRNGVGTHRVVERRIATGCRARRAEEAFDDLVGRSPEYVRSWIQRKADLADGIQVGVAVVDADSVVEEVNGSVDEITRWISTCDSRRGSTPNIRGTLVAGLCRQIAGLRFRDIEQLLECSTSTARKLSMRHGELVRSDEAYAALAGGVAHRAARRCHGL